MRSVVARGLLAAMFAAVLAGCTGLARNIDASADDAQRRAARRMAEVSPSKTPASDEVTISEGSWIAKSGVRIVRQESLPAVFSSKATFNRRVRSLGEFAERIGMLSGLQTRVTPDALQAGGRGPADAPGRGTLVAGRGPGAIPPPSSLQAPLAPTAGMASASNGVQLIYRDGDLKGLLDMAAARFGVSWKYVDGAIEFHHLDTRAFQISAVPGESALSANVGSGSAGEGAQGAAGGGNAMGNGGSTGNTQNTAVRSQLSVFASLEKSVGAMLSSHGSVVSSPATGTLTVTDTPAILDRVEKFIERENRSLSRQVLINVTVLSVSVADEDNYGLNWDLVFTELSRKYGIKNTFGGAQAGGTAFSASVLNTSNSKFAGSSMIINALSTQGKVRKETSASVAALNHQPVPVQVGRQTAYLKSTQTTISANVGSQTSLTPGVVNSGFSMTVLPSVLDNGTVILQFSTDISTLRRLNTVSSSGSSGGSQIQTPEIDTRNFLQRVAMKSGQTLVVSGFEQMEGSVDRQGVGTPSNFALGGGVAARSNKEVVVILVTPIAMPGA